MSELVKVFIAVSFAASRHRNQHRKGADESPSTNHPIDVTHVLAVTGGVGDVVRRFVE
jgi:guanosine-3',5'-bis(diphosphate) 3'-pyrophosphohydrolase